MGRKRRTKDRPSYAKRRETPAEIAERAEVIKAILARQITISDGAEKLGIARVNMQTLVHRAEAALIEALLPKPSGPTPTAEPQKKLEAEVESLRSKNAKLRSQLESMDGLLGIAGDVIRGLRGMPPRKATPRSGSPSSTRSSTDSDEDPEDPDPAAVLAAKVRAMREHGRRAARAFGVACSTLRRWLARIANGEPIWRRRGAQPVTVTADAEVQAREHIRALGGLVGADSLNHSIEGITRSAARRIKREEETAIERERREACDRVEVLAPGVMRGFDAMYLDTDEGLRYGLIAGDACVPFRTSANDNDRYDAASVVAALERDMDEHGAPLVLRMDRAACQRTPDVLSMLDRRDVLLLEGPPHHPGYYGQLERQNREHRGWLEYIGPLVAERLPDELTRMRVALNRRWRRRRLGWRTAEEVWMSRPPLHIDRNALHAEVAERAARLRANNVREDLALRLAIEKALMNRGYLKITPGRKVLCG